jgi:hypothetical protein
MQYYLFLLLACVLLNAKFAWSAKIDVNNHANEAVLNISHQKPVTLLNLNTTSNGWTMYKQCDSQWANQQLGTCDHTICSAGCAMSSVAMILTTKGANHNPGNLDHWLTQNGGYSSGCLINWASVDAFGVTKFQGHQNPTESEICSGLSAGHGLVANVHNGGHWVLLTGCAGNGVFNVNDPGYSTTTYTMHDIVGMAVYH